LSLARLWSVCNLQSRRLPYMEHRCVPRYEVEIPVYARAHLGVVSSVGCLLNVSEAGGFLLTTLPAKLHSNVSLQLIDGGLSLNLEGQVVRRSFAGLGIEWCEPAAKLIRTLDVNSERCSRGGKSAASGS
jgi:PilZ domain-containing protein